MVVEADLTDSDLDARPPVSTAAVPELTLYHHTLDEVEARADPKVRVDGRAVCCGGSAREVG